MYGWMAIVTALTPPESMSIEPHLLFLLGFGALALIVAWLPLLLNRVPLSLPIICVVLGYAAFAGAPPRFGSFNLEPHILLEYLLEIVLLIALMGAGLKIDRLFGFRRWSTTWRLLGIAMPLMVVGVAALAFYIGHFSLPGALLLGAALAPTDPVLASDVGVGPPGTGEEGEVRFGLTSEAGLNDGLAFPFALLALAFAAAEVPDARWIADHFVWKVALAAVIGWAIGRSLGKLQFRFPRLESSEASNGIAAIGITVIAFAVTQVAGGYGFLAVFVCAVSLRTICREHNVHRAMADFSGQIERLLAMLVIVLLGAAIAAGLLSALTWRDAGLALTMLFVLRPATALLSLWGSVHPLVSRAATAYFGIRGIGTLYYLTYAFNHRDFPEEARLWSFGGFVVLSSIVVHGLSATPLMRRLDEIRERTTGRR
jgi:NhaP-type Na+/H+ or K+/H+ antiporter